MIRSAESQKQLLPVFSLLVALFFLGCGGASRAGAQGPEAIDTTGSLLPDEAGASISGPTEPTYPVVAEVPEAALGPRLALTSFGKVLVWAVPTGDSAGLYSLALADGDERAQPRRLSSVDASARQLQVGMTDKGQILASLVHKVDDQDVLTVTRIGADGRLLAGPVVVTTVPASILFTRVVPTALGALVLWVEKAGSSADFYAAAVKIQGPQRALRVVRGVSAWQVAEGGDAVTLVTREGTASAKMVLRHMGAGGDVLGAPIVLSPNVVGGSDVDVALSKDQTLVVWSEKGAATSRLMGTLLDKRGNVLSKAAALTPARGDQALLGVAAHPVVGTFHLMWQEPRWARRGERSVFVGTLDFDSFQLALDARLKVARKDYLLPLMAASSQGLAVLTDVSCSPEESTCRDAERAAVLIPSGGEAPRGALLTAVGDRPLTMVWDLTCSKDACSFLLADDSSPVRVSVGDVAPASALERVVVAATDELPALVSHEAIGEVPELTELAGAPSAKGGALLSWLSYFDPDQPYVVPSQPAPDGRHAPVRALLTALQLNADAPAILQESVISYRARSLGGVAVVAPLDNRGLLAWSALDGNAPQLFVTLVDARGVRVQQKMLTTTQGEVTDVAATRVEGGYLLSWVDEVGASPEVYALVVSDALVPSGKPQRISQGALSPSGVALIAGERGVHCVWADARGADKSGGSALFATLLDPKTAAPVKAEKRLTKSAEHSHSPQMIRSARGPVLLAWLEEPQKSEGTMPGALRFAFLGQDGELSSPAGRWRAPGAATDLALRCGLSECSAVVVVASPESTSGSAVSLFGVARLRPEETQLVRASPLLPLWTKSPEGVSPVALGDAVYFSDQDSSGRTWNLHRAVIKWED